ncbi:hypothetical protein FHR83_006293 [Actinoplanes campanulatus]|uniref:Uncharacterized protein n=1 Tax=Actinoplanes campanulatus TaxID=113559 RepID=A0A7W5AMS2_9ACTN|nr:hypothetical protein [Actinoplanes campanulatus]MBB3098594.1 hypothetical protein [Actinoplanes campanulatus]GGN36036.1 hypothetical protein GCM10010109_60620 [Actinoplanes campanulatus]GID39285.1 hypothetical protein Aca09nite_57910 [Actinoplanes campanulatus]
MTNPPAAPLTAFVPEPPDADWETIRARVMARLGAETPPSWTDHNPVDPGVTLAESAAFGLADLHYRVAQRRMEAWPLEARSFAPDTDRHWHGTIPAGSLTAIAGALAASAPGSATTLESLVRAAASQADAVALLSKPPWAGVFTAPQRPAVVTLLRGRLVRRIAQEQTDIVAEAVAAERAGGGTVAARDARAAATLRHTLPLWPEEIAAVVRRERRRLSREALVARLDEVRAATAMTAPAIRAVLAAADLDATEADLAMAVAGQPPGMLPEHLEDPGGRSLIWPPHPIQALTSEPVTAGDYARRARAHPGVGRAWAVPGRLPGIAWNGLPTGATPEIAADPQAPAVTLIVERITGTGNSDGFLRAVLTAAIGPEAGAPFPDWRDDVDDLAPRRVIGDEVGAGLLAEAPILVQATLVGPVGIDRDAVIADVRGRIAALFARDEPEPGPPAAEPVVDGPWPRIDQPAGGWAPGEPIRFTEVVDAMAGNPDVWGVELLAMKVQGDPSFLPQSAGSLPIPPNAVPVLAAANCLTVRLALTGRCGDA